MRPDPSSSSASSLTRRRWLRGSLLLTAATIAAPAASAIGATTGESRAKRNSTLPSFSLFRASILDDQAQYALGAASFGASELGEILEVARRINRRTKDPAQPTRHTFTVFVREWESLGRRLERSAEKALAAGQSSTARARYLRASTYFDVALYFVLGTSRPDREQSVFQACERCWQQAIALWDPRPITLPIRVDGLDLPAWFFRPDATGRRRPTYIICNGSDGQNVETVGLGLAAALERGYNVVVFEGPGQMSLLFDRGVVFRPDWSPILRAITSTLAARSDVDAARIAACGISFLGMVLASAAASGSGLTACVLEPGGVSYPDCWGDQSTIRTVIEAQGAPAAEKARIRAEVNAGFLQAWPSLPPSVQFTIHKRGEIFSLAVRDEARQGRPPSDYFGLLETLLAFQYQSDLRAITVPTLVTCNQDDEFFQAQSKEAYALLDALPDSRKRRLDLTAALGTAGHDQPIGQRAAQEFIFDWLGEVLDVRD